MNDDRRQFDNQIISKKSKPIDEDDHSKRKGKKNKRKDQDEPTQGQTLTNGGQLAQTSVNVPMVKDKKAEQEQTLKDLACILSGYKTATIKKALTHHNYNKTQTMNALLQMTPDNEQEQTLGKQMQKLAKIQQKKSQNRSTSTNHSEVANGLVNQVFDNLLKEEIEDINGREFQQLFEEIAEMIKEDQRDRGMGMLEINNFVDQCNSIKQTLLVGFKEELSNFDDFYEFDQSYPLVTQTQEFLWAINKKQAKQEKKLEEDFPLLGHSAPVAAKQEKNIIQRIQLTQRKKKEEVSLFTPSKNTLSHYARERSNEVSIFNVDNKLKSQRDLMSLHKEFSDVAIRDLKFAYKTFAGDYNICREFLIKYYDDKRITRVLEPTRPIQKEVARKHTSRLRKEEVDEQVRHLTLKEVREEIDHLFKLRQALQITKMKIKSTSQKHQLDRMILEKAPLIKKLALASRLKEVEQMQRTNPLYVDMHGYREEEVEPLLECISEMLREEYEKRNQRIRVKKVRGRLAACLVAVTGKGLHSRGNRSILRPAVVSWCNLKDLDCEQQQDHWLDPDTIKQIMNNCTAIYIGRTYLSRNLTTPHDYAVSVHLYELLTEATKVLLRKNGVTSGKVIEEFLQQANKGENVLLKSYGSFSRSVVCKLCFLHNFMKIFETETIPRNGLDYYQLSRLLCSDFPREFILRAAAVLLPQQDPTNQMYVTLSSRKFAQALYVQMIYTEYIETIQSHFQQEQGLDFLQSYRVLRTQDTKNIKEYNKPPFSVMAQALLSLMRRKGLLLQQQSKVVFITEENIQDFIRDSTTNHPDKLLTFPELMREVVQSSEFAELVQENLGMFENSPTWAIQNHKLLSAKEPIQLPLNVKKKGSKK